ncbi:nucleolar protein 6-like, partial [Ctenocephalides felis]|uniref:nucleolar protein 6-like n=1 Tax=Ctenocephalides felis TaxID=7515 RepID=UPI000E6E574E
ESYDEFALFFHDTYGGDFIAVLWKPQAFEKKEFKVSHLNGRKVVTVDGKPMLVSNLGAIIEDFYILAKD